VKKILRDAFLTFNVLIVNIITTLLNIKGANLVKMYYKK